MKESPENDDADRLREELRRRDHFLGVASHELRNPMHSLSLQLASAQSLAAVSGAHEVANRLAQVQTALSRYLDRAIVLLDLARLDAGTYPVRRYDINLSSLLSELVENFENESRFHGTNLQFSGPTQCMVRTDPTIIEQIVGNLLINAIKHSGGTAITVRLSSDAEDNAIIDIDDNGIGIGAAERAKLLASSDETALTRSSVGFGLGLWIVRELARALKTSVVSENKLGQGSLFRLKLRPDLLTSPPER